MKVTCNRSALLDAVSMANAVVPSRSTKPVLQCLRLDAMDDHIVVMATDLEVAVRARVNEVETARTGQALAPASELQGILRETSDATVELEYDDDSLMVRGSDSDFRLYGFDIREYPPIPEVEGESAQTIETSTLKELAKKTVYAAAREVSRYAINGVQWERKNNRLQMVATDGRRLAVASGPFAGKSSSDELKCIVPTRMMGLLDRLLEDDDGKVGIHATDTQLLLHTEQIMLSTVLVEGTFPNYEDVIPKDINFSVELEVPSFLSAVRRAALLSDDESKGVRMLFSSGTLTVLAEAAERGQAKVTFSVDYDGEDFNVAFNPHFLVDALRVVGTDTVSLEFTEATRPSVMKAGAGFLYVVMPVELPGGKR